MIMKEADIGPTVHAVRSKREIPEFSYSFNAQLQAKFSKALHQCFEALLHSSQAFMTKLTYAHRPQRSLPHAV